MNPETKQIYQRYLNLAEEVKKELDDYALGRDLQLSDAVFHWDFAIYLFDYLDGKMSKDAFKERLKGLLLLLEQARKREERASGRTGEWGLNLKDAL